MDLSKVFQIAGAGLMTQSARLRVVSENLANAETLGRTPDEAPYRRKMITFRNVFNDELGAETVKVDDVILDRTAFSQRFEPSHPAANADGYVLVPNVNPLIEMMDVREAQRTYQANLSVIEVARAMMQNTLDILQS